MRAHAAPFTDLWATASMNFRLTPIPLRRTETRILPALSQLLRQCPRGLVGATHRHLPRPHVTRMQTRVAIGGQPMRLQDTRIHAIYVVRKCSVATKFALRVRIP